MNNLFSPVEAAPSGAPSRSTLATLTAVIMAHGAAGPLTAQTASTAEEATRLPDVLVEGQKTKPLSTPKFTAPLIDTPQTVSVISSEIFNQQGAQNLGDVLRNTPGITFLAGEGGNPTSADGDSFFMRGFDASASVFIDGVRDTGQYRRDVFNLEQVEVVKGPAGSDVGRTTPSGFINLSTKGARLEQFVAGTLSYGDEDKKRATLDYSQPLENSAIKGTSFRLNALWQDGGVAGRRTVENNRWGIAPALAFGLGTPTRVHLSYQHLRQEDIPDYGLPRAALPGTANGGGGSYTPPAPRVSQKTFYGTVHDFDDVTNDIYSLRLERDLNPHATLSNQTRSARTERLAFVTPPGNYAADTGLLPRSRQGNQRRSESFTNLANLSARANTGAWQHALSAGLEYIWEKTQTWSYTAAVLPPTPFISPDIHSPVADPTPSGATTRGTIETLGFYLFDTVRLDERWQVTGGFRWENYDLAYRSTAAGGTPNAPVDTDDDTLSWKAGVVYKPAAQGSLYAAYGNSTISPGTNPTFQAATSGTSANNINIDPQEAHNYELGTKWDFFKRRLSTSLAFFYTKNTNIGIATDPVTGDIVQTGNQKVKGVELGLSGKITEHWLIFGGFSIMDSENSNASNAAADGAQIQWTPETSGNIWTSYQLPIGLTIGGGANYTDGAFRSTTNNTITNITGIDSYWLFHAMASYAFNTRLTLRLNVNNLFDEDYLRSVNNNGGRYNPGTPRNFLISADWRF